VGGLGSGRRLGRTTKRQVEWCLPLDANDLDRRHLAGIEGDIRLQAPKCGWCVDAHYLLRYDGTELRLTFWFGLGEIDVAVVTTGTALGAGRAYFRCPGLPGRAACGARVGKLYWPLVGRPVLPADVATISPTRAPRNVDARSMSSGSESLRERRTTAAGSRRRRARLRPTLVAQLENILPGRAHGIPRSGAGAPDVATIDGPIPIFVECKGGEPLQPNQVDWIEQVLPGGLRRRSFAVVVRRDARP
jgi:hypothetical protein